MKKLLYFLLTHSPNFKIIRGLVNLEKPRFLVQFFIRFYFVKILKVNLAEAEKTVDNYPSVLSFFTRRLKSGVRPIEKESNSIISPVDARILEHGKIEKNRLIQAKGRYYSLEELVGQKSEEFLDGQFVTLYLSPRDYHRIHHPVAGKVTQVDYYPGNLYPVNPFSLSNFDRVFSRNKRIVVNYQSSKVNILSCWVGALNVGELKVLFDEKFYRSATPNYDQNYHQKFFSKPYQLSIKKGEEAGCFELGSTVILIFPPQKVKLTFKEDFIYLGQEIAKII